MWNQNEQSQVIQHLKLPSTEENSTEIVQKTDSKEVDKQTVATNQPTFVVLGYNGSFLIEQILLELGWKKQVDRSSDSFRLKWVETRNSVNYNTFREGEQLVNRIPNCFLLTNKLGLLTSLQAYERIWTALNFGWKSKFCASDFIPETYRLDDSTERHIFYEIFKKDDIWICKPVALNQGRGIYLVRDIEDFRKALKERDEVEKKRIRLPPMDRIIQRYITNPLLVEGKKFDIRVFMLIASTSPYLVLFHKGYARICLQLYSNQTEDMGAHLTNQFVQKRYSTYEFFKEDTIWSFEQLNNFINTNIAPEKGIEMDWVYGTLMSQMKQIMLYCFHAVKYKLKAKIGYFDLYGFDFLVDENMKVWLIEINANPCLARNCTVLRDIIPSVIRETLYLAIECFEKSRHGLPLFPLNALKNFQIIYSGSHSSAYNNPAFQSAKRSWSSIYPVLKNYFSRHDAIEKINYTNQNHSTCVFCDSQNEQQGSTVENVTVGPVSMFDLSNIASKKLQVFRAVLTNSHSECKKSVTSKTNGSNSLDLSSLKNKEIDEEKENEHVKVSSAEENTASIEANSKCTRNSKARWKSPAFEASLTEERAMFRKSNSAHVLFCVSDKGNARSVLSDRHKATSKEGDQNLCNLDNSPKKSKQLNNEPVQVENSNPDQVKPETTSANDEELLKSQILITTKPANGGAAKSKTTATTQQPASEIFYSKSRSNSLTTDLDQSLTMFSEEQKSSPGDMKNQKTIFSEQFKYQYNQVIWDKTNSILISKPVDDSTIANRLAESLYGLPRKKSPVKFNIIRVQERNKKPTDTEMLPLSLGKGKQSLKNESAFSRQVHNINAFFKPMQSLSSSSPKVEKKSGQLDSIVEQLEKDLAKIRNQRAIAQASSNFRVVNTDLNLTQSTSASVTSPKSCIPIVKQITDHALHSFDKGTVLGSQNQINDSDSKYSGSKLYPRIKLNFQPVKDNRLPQLPSLVQSIGTAGKSVPSFSESLQYRQTAVENLANDHGNKFESKL